MTPTQKSVPFSFLREVLLPVSVVVVGGVLAYEATRWWRGRGDDDDDLELEEAEVA